MTENHLWTLLLLLLMWNFGFFFYFIFFIFAPSAELLFSIRPPGGGRGDQGVAAAVYWITVRELTLQRDTRDSETLCTLKVYHRKWGCLCVRVSGVFPLLIPEVFSSRHFSSHCVFSTVVCFREWMCAHRRLFVCFFSWSLCATACRGVATSQSSQVTVRSRDHEWSTAATAPAPPCLLKRFLARSHGCLCRINE